MEYPPKSAGTNTTFRQIDPGPRPRRQKRLCCSTLLGRVFILFLFLSFVWLFYTPIRGLLGFITLATPNADLLQDRNVPYRPEDVVRPLIDRDQSFDIVATVWLRSDVSLGNDSTDSSKESQVGHWQENLELKETPIFSDTVFRGLQLKDKNKKTSVKFQVPTEIFKKRDLNNYDLRASFVLVPNSPSLLDSAVSFNKWRPNAARYPPVRPWKEHDTRSLKEDIVDFYGTFIPLLSFHNIQSRCPNTTDDSDQVEEDSDKSDELSPKTSSDLDDSRERYTSTEGKHVLQSHPYIITRSYLRVVDVTELYNREAYERLHLILTSISCGMPNNPDWRDCERSFSRTGNQEVEIKLSRKDDELGEIHTEYAYAPYLSLSRKAWGPLDLVPVPVNRQDCAQTNSTSESTISEALVPDEESVSITWNIAFSGRTPRKLKIADWAGSVVPNMGSLNMTDPAMHKPMQWLVEHAESVGGHQHRDDYHPRRVMILTVLRVTFSILESILDILYWYTRSSTVGLSTLGIKMISIGTMSQYLTIFLVTIFKSESSLFHLLVLCGWNSIFLLRPLLMLKAATRYEVYRYKRWFPAIRFAPETHAERSSQRVESRTPRRVKITIYSFFAMVFGISHYLRSYVLKPTQPGMFPKDDFMDRMDMMIILTARPAIITGWILQIILSVRIKRFAGMYALSAYLSAIACLFQFADNSKRIVGTSLNTSGIDYFDFAEGLCYAVLAVLALRYPRISPGDLDEDSDSQ